MTIVTNTTPTVPPTPTHFIGCDVGKTSIVAFDSRTGKTTTISNKPAELDRFAATLDETCLVICEATGGHEAALLKALLRAGRHAHRADARKVKAFIRSFGTLAKTDPIDARALSIYGRERHRILRRWLDPDAQRAKLQALVLARRDLIADRLAYKNRLAAPGGAILKPYLANLLQSFDKRIADITRDIAALIKDHKAMADAYAALRCIVGIGQTTAAALLALMPELGTLNRRQAASLAGLAPHPRQSGQTDAYRKTRGGRTDIKRVLFMAAMVAAKHDPKQSAFYKKLIQKGKKPLSALTAVMRKLVVIVNAVLRPLTPTQTA
jgi:transposase